MTPTPRTDALELENIGLAWGDAQDAVLGLARELERKLAAERALADRLAQAILFNEHEVLAGEDLFWSEDHASALAAWKEARNDT